MGFNIGLSGIRAAASDLNITGNNIANAGTVGFKLSRAERKVGIIGLLRQGGTHVGRVQVQRGLDGARRPGVGRAGVDPQIRLDTLIDLSGRRSWAPGAMRRAAGCCLAT